MFNPQKILELQRKSGKKTSDFSQAIFGSPSMGPRYFLDKDKISSEHLEKLCMYYGVPMETFFTDLPDCCKLNNQQSASTVTSHESYINYDALMSQINGLKEMLKMKDTAIGYLNNHIDSLKETIALMNKSNS
ncbi:MAG: hypothetical protein ACI3Y0_05005 [Prevotella sp.]